MTTPARKLGITPGSRVLLLGAPAGFAVEGLPGGLRPHRRAGAGPYDVILLFFRDRAALHARLRDAGDLIGLLDTAGGLWLCWPKRSSGVATDLTDGAVREAGLATGLVDTKVAAVDEVWSGLRFVRRLADR